MLAVAAGPADRLHAVDAGDGGPRSPAALSVGAMTTVGWDAPAGKCRASTCWPVTDSGFARNCSVWDRPLVMPDQGQREQHEQRHARPR